MKVVTSQTWNDCQVDMMEPKLFAKPDQFVGYSQIEYHEGTNALLQYHVV